MTPSDTSTQSTKSMRSAHRKGRRIPMPANSLVDASFEFATVPFILELEGRVERDEILNLARSHFRDVVELNSFLVRPKVGYPFWQEHLDFDYDQVVLERVLADTSYSNLTTEIGEINSVAIAKYEKIAWDIHVLQPPISEKGSTTEQPDIRGTILLIRVDHSLTDGRGGLQVIELLAGRPPKHGTQSTGRKQNPKSMYTRKSIKSLLGAAANSNPDPISPIKSEKTSYDLGYAWTPQPWSISDMKLVLKKIAPTSTLNDLTMAIIDGAIQKYLEHKGFDSSQTPIHNSAMVDLFSKFIEPTLPARPTIHSPLTRKPLLNPVFGNGVGMIMYTIPTQSKNPMDRLQSITKIMTQERQSDYSSSRLAGKLLDKIGLLPRPMLRAIIINGGKSISTYVSNLNFNLPDELIIANKKVKHARFCGTPNGTLAIYFPVMSFKGGLYVNLGYHRNMFTPEDIQFIIGLLGEEYDELVTKNLVVGKDVKVASLDDAAAPVTEAAAVAAAA